jgi:NADPH:quinone reductase-like Zn-dependent oxidoreductase
MMRAFLIERYGPPERLRLTDVPCPEVGEDDVLVRVRAASVNPYDWHMVRGKPRIVRPLVGLRRPKAPGLGLDCAGIVEHVGAAVTEFAPGDEVIGSASGTFAEYARGKERHFVRKPARLDFEQAAALPGAGGTALHALRTLRAGRRVLVNGASGGVGTFAVQIAKLRGAHVTGVCSTRNVELVRSLGADAVIDYTAENFTRSGESYDLIVDMVGNHSPRALRRVLTPAGTIVAVGGGLRVKLRARFADRCVPLFVRVTKDDLVELAQLEELTPVIDRTYPLEETPAAIAYVETRRARGKVVITTS